MKKLTNKQIKSLLETGAFRKDGEWSQALNAEYFVMRLADGWKVHFRTSGSRGKRSGVRESALIARDVMEAMGYTVRTENDAPRGGELGDHFIMRAVNVTPFEVAQQVKAFIAK